MVTEDFNQNKHADFMYTLYYSIGTYVKENVLNDKPVYTMDRDMINAHRVDSLNIY